MENCRFQSARSLYPGQIVSKRFRITECIGSGAMGCVYLCEDADMNDRLCALKVLHPHFTADESLVKRFLREVRLINSINHPNVVRTYHIGRHEELLYYSMEYAPGVVLDKFKGLRNISLDRLTDIIIQICDGISAIHKAGVIHRDFKPGNVIILPDYRVKIVDFGVARPLSSQLTQHEEIMGSLEYIAPEIWKGEDVAPHTDLYSLGIMLYQVVTGVTPFGEASIARIMWKHVHETPIAPIAKVANIPEWLNDLIMWLLEKQPDDRPSSASEVKEYINIHTGNTPEKVISLFSSSNHTKFDAEKIVAFPMTATSTVEVQCQSLEHSNSDLANSRNRQERIVSPSIENDINWRHHRERPKHPQLGSMRNYIGGFAVAFSVLIAGFAIPQLYTEYPDAELKPQVTKSAQEASTSSNSNKLANTSSIETSFRESVLALRKLSRKIVLRNSASIPAITAFLKASGGDTELSQVSIKNNAETLEKLSQQNPLLAELIIKRAPGLVNAGLASEDLEEAPAFRSESLDSLQIAREKRIIAQINNGSFSLEKALENSRQIIKTNQEATQIIDKELSQARKNIGKFKSQILRLDEEKLLINSKSLSNYHPQIYYSIMEFEDSLHHFAKIRKHGGNKDLAASELTRKYQRLFLKTTEGIENNLRSQNKSIQTLVSLKDSLLSLESAAQETHKLLSGISDESPSSLSTLRSYLEQKTNASNSKLA